VATPGRAPDLEIGSQSAKAVLRYQEGYRVAKAINGLSPLCKVVGLIAGMFVVFFGVMGSELLMRPNPALAGLANYQTQHNVYLISVIFLGLFVVLAGWIIGSLVAGYSQHLSATLDAAVHGSPFLNDSQRAEILRLG
jgi:uncharacterized membrane protein